MTSFKTDQAVKNLLLFIDAYPHGEFKPYTCPNCKKKCGAIINEKYCMECFKNDV